MLGFDVDAERAEAAVIRSAQLVLGDVFGCLDQSITNLLRRLDLGNQWVDHTDERDLLDPIGVRSNALSDLLVHYGLVLLGRQLDQEVAGVHLEHGWEQFMIVDIIGMHRVTVTTRARMDSDVLSLFGGKSIWNLARQCCRGLLEH